MPKKCRVRCCPHLRNIYGTTTYLSVTSHKKRREEEAPTTLTLNRDVREPDGNHGHLLRHQLTGHERLPNEFQAFEYLSNTRQREQTSVPVAHKHFRNAWEKAYASSRIWTAVHVTHSMPSPVSSPDFENPILGMKVWSPITRNDMLALAEKRK